MHTCAELEDSMGQLEAKRAVIIGAAERGSIGHAIAVRYASEGAKVYIASRRGDQCLEVGAELKGFGGPCDLTSKAQVFAMFDDAKRLMGGVDIAINSTGLALGGPFLEYSEADMDTLIALQFKGSFFFLQAATALMAKAGGGSIIQLSSAVAQPGTTVDDGYEAYMGTKAGIDQVVRAVANQFGKFQVRVNTIALGHTDTPMHKRNFEGGDIPQWMKNAFIEQYPLGRYGKADDVAEATVWLGRDQCFMTGSVLQVNGGLTLRRNPLSFDFQRCRREWEREHGG
jgi:NAD(P)-dependent dehydrogenase (short-subunit alcohol dehydrogenase family)